ncbi:MAG: helix-turn-helix domain-containing protein [Oscillospiraceae bacterium]
MAIIEHARYYDSPMHKVSHAHTSCEIMHIVSGRLHITAGEDTVTLSDGDSALIKSRQRHDVTVDKAPDYRRFITVINPWELKKQLTRPDLFSMLTDTSKGGIIVIKNKPELMSGFEKMADIFSRGGNIYAELGAALNIVSAFYDIVYPRGEKSAERAGRILSDRVREYIEQNYSDSIKIADIAAENFISEGYLAHVFKAETGMSPREYLTHIRCTRACELIRYTAMRFADIADVTGFCCANDMSRKIREFCGLSPTELRYNTPSQTP